tara:strand:+ start:2880 stop:3137 length:258 start_codon:yes stop_codon:yes gene_type:complete
MTGPSNFAELVGVVTNYISLLVPIVFALTFLYIAWGIINAWIINGGDEQAVEEGKKIALIGVVALTFMFGIWGVLRILQGAFGWG